MNNMNNEKRNKSAVILNPERSEWVSRSHVTGVEIVVNDGVKTKRYSAKRDLYGDFAYAQPLKMTRKALSFLRLRGAGKKQKESSLILRKAKFQAIFKFFLSSASGGAGGGKYNRISAFVSMPVLLIRRSLEKFFKKNFRDDRFCFGSAKVVTLTLLFTLATTAESWADEVIPTSGTCNDAGTCLWSIDTAGTLTISAKVGAEDVKMADYDCVGNPCSPSSLVARPWENQIKQIKSVMIGDNITKIGQDAFQNASNLKSVTGMKDVKTIGAGGVFAYTGLTEITIPDGVTYIGSGAFYFIKNMKSVTLPDTINNIGSNTSLFIGNQAEINCLNTKGQCENLRNLLGYTLNGKTFNIISPTSNCETYNNKGCTSCEKEYFLADGMCWAHWEKKHYTPAEAAKWLKEEDNTITITFKK